MKPLPEQVRAQAAQVVERARWVTIDHDRLAAITIDEVDLQPSIDPDRHFLEGSEEAVAAYLVALTAINFGSGWFPTLRKRPGMSGYFTVASMLTDRFRADGPWTNAQLRELTTDEVAATLGQPRDHELMGLFAQALRQLGSFLGDRTPLRLALDAEGSAQALAATVAYGMSMWNDQGFFKRAQILANDLQLGGITRFLDLDALTIFADNLVPHVLRVDGVLHYEPELAAHIDAGLLLTNAAMEREVRAAAVHACALLARRLEVPERVLDGWLWNRGQAPEYKAVARHRTRTVFY